MPLSLPEMSPALILCVWTALLGYILFYLFFDSCSWNDCSFFKTHSLSLLPSTCCFLSSRTVYKLTFSSASYIYFLTAVPAFESPNPLPNICSWNQFDSHLLSIFSALCIQQWARCTKFLSLKAWILQGPFHELPFNNLETSMAIYLLVFVHRVCSIHVYKDLTIS